MDSNMPTRPEGSADMKKYKKDFFQKLIILEGSMQNGFQNRNQRNFLRRTSCVKIDFRHFCIFSEFL